MNKSIVGEILNYFKKKTKRTAKKKRTQVLKVKKIKVMSRRKTRRLKRKTRRAKRKTGRKRIVVNGIKLKTKRATRLKKKGRLKKVVKRRTKIKRTVVTAIIAPLLPLRRPMTKALERKGIKTSKMKFVDIVTKFYNEFVSKKNKATSTYEPIADNFLSDHYLNDIDSDDYNEKSDHLAGVGVGEIVTAVVSFFKKLKDKKAKGEKLMSSEEEIADETKKVEDDLKAKEDNELPVKQKQMKDIIMYVLIVVIVGVVIYMLKNK